MEGESSAASKVLKLGGDKIIVTRKQDGHRVLQHRRRQRLRIYRGLFAEAQAGLSGLGAQRIAAVAAGFKEAHDEQARWGASTGHGHVKRPSRCILRWAKMESYRGSYLTGERVAGRPDSLA